jgi:hypothetical protein
MSRWLGFVSSIPDFVRHMLATQILSPHTWLLAIRLQLRQIINYSLQFLRIASSNSPFQIVRKMCSHPFRYEFSSVPGCSQQDQLILSRLLSHYNKGAQLTREEVEEQENYNQDLAWM